METGQRIGRYQLLEKIGRGGMAEIFKASEQLAGGGSRTVAIKRLFPKLSADREFVAMFVNEARIAASMNHPNIVRTYDLINYGSYYYIVMEYLQGMDLEDLAIIRGGAGLLTPAEVAYIANQVALGLSYAHGRGGAKGAGQVVHRDISPGNILVDVAGRVKITDFGIARAVQYASFTRPGVLKGKYEYMAPEYVKGKPFDGRADLFSLGVVVYEMLTGKNPFSDVGPQKIWKRIVEEDPPPPSRLAAGLPPSLDRVVAKALAKNPEKRFQDGEEFAEALREFFARPGREATAASLGVKVAQVMGGKTPASAAAADLDSFLPAGEERGENTREMYLDELLELVEPVEVPAPPLFSEAEPTATKREGDRGEARTGRRKWLWLAAAAGAAMLSTGGVLWWLLGRRNGWLSVDADLPSEVLLEGESKGRTPLERIPVPSGDVMVEVRRLEGGESRSFTRKIERDQEIRLFVKWKKKQKQQQGKQKKRKRK